MFVDSVRVEQDRDFRARLKTEAAASLPSACFVGCVLRMSRRLREVRDEVCYESSDGNRIERRLKLLSFVLAESEKVFQKK